MESEDKRFVKDNSHFSTNRFTLTKDELLIFAGSNYKFPKDGLDNLKERFDVTDYSKSEEVLGKQRKESEERDKLLEKSANDNGNRQSNR